MVHFTGIVGSFKPGAFRPLPIFMEVTSQAQVAIQALFDKITFFSPPGTSGGQFRSNSGELANGLFRERFDNA